MDVRGQLNVRNGKIYEWVGENMGLRSVGQTILNEHASRAKNNSILVKNLTLNLRMAHSEKQLYL